MSDPQTDTARTEARESIRRDARRRTRANRIWYIGLSILAAAALFVGLVVAVSATPQSCGVCHATAHDTLAESAHVDTTCDDCHGATSFGGLIEARLSVISMMGAALIPGQQSVMPGVDNDLCISCHEEELLGVVTVDGIRMSHRAPIAEKWSCVTCHPTTAHGSSGSRAVSYRQVGYSMDTCLECHSSNPANISGCEVCHAEGTSQSSDDGPKNSWQIAHGPNWQQAHGMGNLQTCKACHAPDYCVACHNMPIPHTPNFASVHGRQAISEGIQDCVVCHKASACENCHGIDMPHPDGFTQGHSTLVEESGTDVCQKCHDEAGCQKCHERHAHPGLETGTMRALRARPAQ